MADTRGHGTRQFRRAGVALACLLAGLPGGRVYGQEPDTGQDVLPTLVPVWAPAPPRIDGRLDDACWRDADTVESFHAVDGGSRHSDVAWAKVAFGPAHLYIAFHVRAEPSSNLHTGTMERDAGVWGSNCVQIFIRPLAAGSFYVFTVNAVNTQRDARDSDVGWDASWESATLVSPAADFWQIELAIPYAAFDLYPSVGPEWRLNLTCVTSIAALTRLQRILTWAPAFGNFHQPDRFGHMRLDRIDWQAWRYSLNASVTPAGPESFAVVVDADATATEAAPADYDVQVRMTDPAGRTVTRTSSMRLPNPAPPPGAPPKGVTRLTFPTATQGRHSFSVGLGRADGTRLVAERRIRAETAPAFEIWTQKSLYAGDTYAVVRVETSQRSAAGRTCRIQLETAAGTAAGEPVRATFDSGSLRAEARLSLERIPHGRYRVVAGWEEPQDDGPGTELAACRLIKVPPQQGTVWYDDRGVLYRDDEPIFPIGMYFIYRQFGDETLRKEYAAAGFNAVQLGWYTRGHYVAHLARMKDWGLDLSLAVMNESRFYNARQKRRLSLDQAVAHVADIARVVGASAPTNLLAYYVQDEPQASEAERLGEWCEAVKVNDPYHPTLICLCFKEALRAYAQVVDILAPDPYPGFPGGPITKVSDFLIEANRAVRGRKPVLAVLQAFGARRKEPVLPTPAELRCMTYLALVHEARGVYYFSYNWNGPLREDHPAQWAELKKLAGEMRDRRDIFLADGAGLTVAEPTFGAPVHARVMKTDAGTYLLAVNTQRTRLENIGFHVPGLGSGTLHAVFGEPDIETTEGRFTNSFAPLAVHFYRFRGRQGEVDL